MSPPTLNAPALGRAAAALLLVVAILASAVSIRLADRQGREVGAAAGAPSTDPDLERCRDLGAAAETDGACLRVWAHLRERFYEAPLPTRRGS